MTSCEIAALVTSIACTLFKQCEKDDLALTAAIFNQLGDTITTMIGFDQLCENQGKKDPETEFDDDFLDELLR